MIPERANQQFAQAVALLQAGKLTDAELELKQLILAYPEYPGPYVNLGLLYERAGKYAEAEQALRQAHAEGHAQRTDLLPNWASPIASWAASRTPRVRMRQAIKIDPNYAPAHLNLGVLCDLYLQQPQRALEALERYMELSGNSDKRVATWIAELKARVGSNPKPQTAEASPRLAHVAQSLRARCCPRFAVSAQNVPPAEEREAVMPQAETSAPTPAAQARDRQGVACSAGEFSDNAARH